MTKTLGSIRQCVHNENMPVKVKLFASMREYLDLNETEIPIENIETVADVWQAIARDKPMPENTLCAVNLEHTNEAAGISDGDEVAFFPPVTGG